MNERQAKQDGTGLFSRHSGEIRFRNGNTTAHRREREVVGYKKFLCPCKEVA